MDLEIQSELDLARIRRNDTASKAETLISIFRPVSATPESFISSQKVDGDVPESKSDLTNKKPRRRKKSEEPSGAVAMGHEPSVSRRPNTVFDRLSNVSRCVPPSWLTSIHPSIHPSIHIYLSHISFKAFLFLQNSILTIHVSKRKHPIVCSRLL